MGDCVWQWACKTVAITLHYSLTALFCWMLVEGIHIYVLLVKVFKRGSHLKKYCAIGWGTRTEGIKLCCAHPLLVHGTMKVVSIYLY